MDSSDSSAGSPRASRFMDTTERTRSLLAFVLSPENVCYFRIKIPSPLHNDGQDRQSAKPVDTKCAYVLFCYEIKLESLGVQ